MKPEFEERHREAIEQVVNELEKGMEQEKDESVRQDLAILIDSERRSIRAVELDKKFIQFYDANEIAYWGIASLLDDQVPQERRLKALVRLRKYAGMEQGYEPLTKLCEDRMRERLNVLRLLGPFKGWVERSLSNTETHSSAIAKLFDKYHIAGYEPAYRKLREQLTEFNEFAGSGRQGRMFVEADPVGRGFSAPSATPLRGPLSGGTKSPRQRQPPAVPLADSSSPRKTRTGALSGTAGRPAAIL